MLKTIIEAFDITGGSRTNCEEDGPVRRTRLAMVAMLAAGGAAAIFGVAVGSTDVALALGNVIKVPLALLLSSVFAIPATMLALKLTDRPISYTNFLVAQAAAIFSGALVLAAGAPVAGLFYHTSATIGPWAAMLVAHGAVIVGFIVLLRGVLSRRSEGASVKMLMVPLGVFATLQVVALVQLIAIASPILPEVTPYSAGAEGLVSSVE